MFGETESESPRMPSPWDALKVPSSTSVHSGAGFTPPIPSPLTLPSPSTPGELGVDGSNSDQINSLHTSDPALPDESKSHPRTPDIKMPLLDSELARLAAEVSLSGDPVLKLVPEIEEGNVEYKLKLINPTADRFMKLVTQLKYRLLEGGGQALYEIGVSDNGQLVGLSRKELNESLDTLERMAGELGATVVVLKEIMLPPDTPFLGPPTLQLKKDKDMSKPKQAKGRGKGRHPSTAMSRKKRPLLQEAVGRVQDSSEASDTNSPVDSGVDLSSTVGAQIINAGDSRTSASPSPSPRSPHPLPVITPYPYGHQPFVSSRKRVNSGVERAPALNSATSGEEYYYSTSDPKPESDSNQDAHKGDEDDDGDGFGFDFDLEISSFTQNTKQTSPAMSYLAPSPHVKPSHAKKPLHYSSFKAQSIASAQSNAGNWVELSTTTETDPKGHRKEGNKSKNPLSNTPVLPSGKNLTPEEKALERKLKRDARREERRAQANSETQHDGILANATDTRPDADPEMAASEDDDVPPEGPAAPPLIAQDEKGTRFMAEALVVRKLAIDEAFLDFGGFGIVVQGPELDEFEEPNLAILS